MAEELYDEGYVNVTSIDNSYTATKLMQDEYKEKLPNLVFKQMDVRSMAFKDATFDLVIDKALLDAMVCTDGANSNVNLMLADIHRVLNPSGTYICVSHGTEAQRKKYIKNLKKYNWIRTKTMIQKPGIGPNAKELKIPKEDDKKNFNFVYVCKKQVNPIVDSSDEEAVAAEKARLEQEEKERQEAIRRAMEEADESGSGSGDDDDDDDDEDSDN